MSDATRFLWRGPGTLHAVVDGIRVVFAERSRVPAETVTPERLQYLVEHGQASLTLTGDGPYRDDVQDCFRVSVGMNPDTPSIEEKLRAIFTRARAGASEPKEPKYK